MAPELLTIPIDDGATTSGRRYSATTRSFATLVLAHGAGAPQTHPFMVRTANDLARRGVDVVTFNFAYTEARRRRPDTNDALERCWARVVAHVRGMVGDARPLFLGGKSMGGRIASQVAANSPERGSGGEAPGRIGDAGKLAGLVFLGYPLHPPGKPEQLRSKHLPAVKAPMLFVQGTRDPFGGPDELVPIVAKLARGTELFPIEGADHSFAVLKRSGVPQEAVYARIADEVVRWMRARLAR
jgi:predicted alpha/beta-hydrolase family hydrolase